jgi:prefoldin subunit 5
VTEKSSLEVREEVVDTDRLRSLLDELEEVQHELEEVQKSEREIKKALKTLIMERF